jgi:hypothetical protein
MNGRGVAVCCDFLLGFECADAMTLDNLHKEVQ